jgi:hypothetical protein
MVELSDYEKMRLANIKRNDEVIRSLGLSKKVTPAKKEAKAVKTEAKPSAPARRSARNRKTVSTYTDDWAGVSGDEGSDYQDEGGAEDSDHAEVESDRQGTVGRKRRARGASGTEIPLPKKARSRTKGESTSASTTAEKSELGGIICEAAKTSRSTCRKCGEGIEQGTQRVGMKSWIVGRQALTWQCPVCFLGNLTCANDASGRSRCKLTDEPFARGEFKIGARSHTATSFFKPAAAAAVLAAVAAVVPPEERKHARETVLRVGSVDGSDGLGEADRAVLESVLAGAASELRTRTLPDPPAASVKEEAPVKKEATSVKKEESTQPELGVKTGAKGGVEWKWGGLVCSGVLLPSKETGTHCYAKTHKGNVKTLAKGKGYWWTVAC